jgi:hypothetical protein
MMIDGNSLSARYTAYFMSVSRPSSRAPLTDDQESSAGVPSKWKVAPSLSEILLLCLTTCVIFVAFVALFRNYAAAVDDFGDSSAYMTLASAIRRWNFGGLVVKQFWGLPYAMAALSTVTRISDRTALLTISLVASLVSVALTWKLWKGWIAGFFAVLNFDWLQRSYLGGSEPLFVALLFGSFFAVRKERWLLGALLASLATVVRPLGIFALLGIGVVLLIRRDWRTLLAAIVIGAVVGGLYVLPLAQHFGDPLANVNSYHSQQWQGGWLFGIPFYAIIKGTLTEPAPITNLVLSFGWIFLILAAIISMARSTEFRSYARNHLVETIFLVPYLWTLYTYNYHWARGNFARFAIPTVPFALLALYRWIPKDRRILWGLAVISLILAAVSAIGIVNVAQVSRHAL